MNQKLAVTHLNEIITVTGCTPRARVICMAGRYADHVMGAIQLSGGIELGLLKGHLFVVVGFWLCSRPLYRVAA
jgi:hypothetical protein